MEGAQSISALQAFQVLSQVRKKGIDEADRYISPIMRKSLKTRTLCRFYVALVTEALEAETYDASVAGIGYSLGKGLESLHVSVSGYSDKLLVLMLKVVRNMKDLKVDEARLKLKKEAFLESLDNEVHLSPLKQIGAEWSWLISQHGHLRSEERAALEGRRSY